MWSRCRIPARVALDALLLAPAQADELEQLLDPRSLAPGLDTVELGEVAQVVPGGKALVEPPVAAEHVADPLAYPRRVLDDVPSEHPRHARRRDQQRDQHLDRRRLARPVRAQQAEQLALGDLEAHAPHRLHFEAAAPERAGGRAVGPHEVDRLDDGCHAAILRRVSNVSIVRRAYEAFSRGDMDAVVADMHDEIEWQQAQGLPHGGTYRGLDEVRRNVFDPLDRDWWSEFSAEPDELLDAGDEVVALGRYRGVAKGTGRRLDVPFVHVWSLRDGRVWRFRQFLDTHGWVEALAPDS